MTRSGARVGCYGKLPVAPDFIAHPAGGPGVVVFTRWLEEAVTLSRDRLGDEWPGLFGSLPTHCFVFRAPPGGTLLLGAMFPGRDASGRSFPFCVFVTLEDSVFGALGGNINSFRSFLEGAGALRQGEPNTLEDLHFAVDRLDPLLPAGPARAQNDDPLRDWTVADLDESLEGPGSKGTGRRIVRNLFELAPRYRVSPERIPSLGLRFPLPADNGSAHSVTSLWMDLCSTALGPNLTPPTCFWTAGGGLSHPALADIYATVPVPARFILILDPSKESDWLYPLGNGDAAPFPSEGKPEVAAALEAASRPDVLLSDLRIAVEKAAPHLGA
jgi:type VI secretion system ImpM family protein